MDEAISCPCWRGRFLEILPSPYPHARNWVSDKIQARLQSVSVHCPLWFLCCCFVRPDAQGNKDTWPRGVCDASLQSRRESGVHVTVTPVLWEPPSQGGWWWPRSFHILRR
ncbi:unnamed protein product [Gulo gulo]|uniref:Uncharacterized protein n=1 Tax=Gulo gulo TaxID=48420 RepID=A0A9X9PUD1_GULGU|nr:unnamed protein product [Gulo gulo]